MPFLLARAHVSLYCDDLMDSGVLRALAKDFADFCKLIVGGSMAIAGHEDDYN